LVVRGKNRGGKEKNKGFNISMNTFTKIKTALRIRAPCIGEGGGNPEISNKQGRMKERSLPYAERQRNRQGEQTGSKKYVGGGKVEERKKPEIGARTAPVLRGGGHQGPREKKK